MTALAGLLIVPSGASAARWKGVVVDQDRSRGTISTALRSGEVRTLRASGKVVKRTRAGRHVVVAGTQLADGTYRAQRVRSTSRTRRAKVRGTVVKTRGRQLFVSAGDTTLLVKAARSRKARAASVGEVTTGDVVVADVTIGAGTLSSTVVTDVGDVRVVELEGIVLGLEAGVLRVAVADRGEVLVTVPDGLLSDPPAAGDQVELAASVGEDGSLTLIALDDDDGRDGIEVDEDGELKAEGSLSALGDGAISVTVGGQTLTCGVPSGTDLSAFAIGGSVEAKCELVDGALVLVKLEGDGAELKRKDDGSYVLEVEGADDAEKDDEPETEDKDDEPETEDKDDEPETEDKDDEPESEDKD